MNLGEINIEIEKHFNYWVGQYSRQELNCNNARITGEYICKACIISKKGERDGMKIINNKNPSIPNAQKRKTHTYAKTLNFLDLVTTLDDLHFFRDKPIQHNHINILRNITNPSSHSAISRDHFVNKEDLETCQNAIVPLIKWYFKDVICKEMPLSIKNAIDGKIDPKYIIDKNEEWQELLHASNYFNHTLNELIIVTPEKIDISKNQILIMLKKIQWKLILDFNPSTEDDGILASQKEINSNSQQVYEITIDQKKPNFIEGWRNRYWFFANGRGKAESISARLWRNKYGNYLNSTLFPSFRELSEKQKIALFFLNDPDQITEIIKGWDIVENGGVKYIICTNQKEYFSSIKDEYKDDLILIDISLNAFINQIDRYFSDNYDTETVRIDIPSRTISGEHTFISIPEADYEKYLSVGIEIWHRATGSTKIDDLGESEHNFLRGATITERNLYLNHDISREDFTRMKEQIYVMLNGSGTHSEELTYYPGTGGTTIARKLAFEFKDEYPTIILRKYIKITTINDLIRIISYNNSLIPIIIFFENHDINESDSRVLIDDINRQKKKAVFIRIKRIYSNTDKSKKLSLQPILSIKERNKFLNKYCLLKPERKPLLEKIETEYASQPELINPFIYGLTAYEENYLKLEDYVSNSIDALTKNQRDFLSYVCLIYYFTGQPVSINLFSTLFDLNRGDTQIYKIIDKSQLLSILIPDNSNRDELAKYRPRYHEVGKEAMQILLAGGREHKYNWHIGIPTKLIKLIELCGWVNEENILKSLLIDRDGTDYAGKYIQESGYKNFSRIFHEMRHNKDASKEVFRKLVDTFPENTHFRGHFARYLYEIAPQDYSEAINQANIALEMSDSKDFNLYHIKGMCYKEQIYAIIRDRNSWINADKSRKEQIEEQIKELSEAACDAFEESRSIRPDNLHAHTAEIQLLVKVLDFGKDISDSSTKENFISNPKNVWYEEKLNFMFSLLDEAKFILEQSRGTEAMRIEKSISYLNECEASMFGVLGNHLMAKERFESEINRSNDRRVLPHFRRMWVYSTLAFRAPGSNRRSFDSWHLLKDSELDQAIKYLELNIEDEPSNGQNLRLWVNAQRASKFPISIERAISKIATWRELNQNQFSKLESDYFLYVLYALQAIKRGDGFDTIPVRKVETILSEIKPQNESFCYEWYGKGDDLRQMLSHKALGDGKIDSSFFIRNQGKLQEVEGEIISIDRNQQGRIKLFCGLTAFFVPIHGNFDANRDIGKRVKFYLGFRQDDMQAWDVIYSNKTREKKDIDNQPDFSSIESSGSEEKPLNDVLESEYITSKAEKLPGLKIIGKIDLTKYSRRK